ncbi:MAG: hypothetical protein ACYDCJ_10235 [Gammaproteobacteria bacterium]
MKDGVGKIVGKTISSVVVGSNVREPRNQVFLVFSDGSSLEFYGSQFTCAGGLDKGGVEDATRYIGKLGGSVSMVYPERKAKVSHEFEKDDGTLGTRSMLEDGMSLPRRIFIRMAKYLRGNEGDGILIPGVNAYNTGKYEDAIKWFITVASLHSELQMELQPHIDACKRVIGTAKDGKDRLYEEKLAEWERKPSFLKRLFKSTTPQLRCKYCGHYTPYVDPLEGLAYLGTNNCSRCGRGYPMPDFSWDGLDGQAYIYYRHSVTEDVFYDEFEERYEVLTPRDHFLKKH